MIIEIKDMPSEPLKKIDIHIEFESGSFPDSPKITLTQTRSVQTEPAAKVSPETEQTEQPDIPQEMINADF